MNKTVKNSLIVIAIVVVLFIIIWLVYDMVKKQPVSADSVDTNLMDENTGLDNFINTLFENVEINEEVEENLVEENEVQEDENTNTTEKEESDKTSGTTSSVTSREDKAVDLVKKEWGGSSGVYFSNDGIDGQGRYIVSVHDKKTTNTLAFYVVNVDTDLVTKQ